MKYEEIYIDLSKCSEKEQKLIVSILPQSLSSLQYEIDEHNFMLYYEDDEWWVNGTKPPVYKTELTYPEFIKLFEGWGETDIEKLAKEALKFQHKNIQDRMIDFVLGFEEGFKKAMELGKTQVGYIKQKKRWME